MFRPCWKRRPATPNFFTCYAHEKGTLYLFFCILFRRRVLLYSQNNIHWTFRDSNNNNYSGKVWREIPPSADDGNLKSVLFFLFVSYSALSVYHNIRRKNNNSYHIIMYFYSYFWTYFLFFGFVVLNCTVVDIQMYVCGRRKNSIAIMSVFIARSHANNAGRKWTERKIPIYISIYRSLEDEKKRGKNGI